VERTETEAATAAPVKAMAASPRAALRVHRLAQAAVISPTPLGIQALGVTESRLGTTETSDVRYRTTGLRLLARSGGKVLLVHDGWTPTTGTVIVLPDSDEFAWQFQR
jgi:hypothetical protein